MKQFGRRWQLDIIGNGDAFRVEKLRVAFDIEKTINDKPNPAKFQIWNLNRNHINQLLSGAYHTVILSVGYNQVQTIYKGDISRVEIKRDGLDFIIEIEGGDGRVAYTQSRVCTSLKAGVTEEQIVKHLKNSLINVKDGPTQIIDNRALPRGKVLQGDSRVLLNICCKNNKADWSIQDGQFLFLPKNYVIDEPAILISQETGMISSPEQTDDGLEVTCLLNTNIKIGGLIELRSIIEHFNGQYKVVRLVHSGDGIGGDWLSKILVVNGDFQKVG